MKSTSPFLHLIFILNYLSPYPLPTFGQPFDWDDAHIHGLQLTAETMAAVQRPFARLTARMNANPQVYGNDILFPHFYLQLVECTRPIPGSSNGQQQQLTGTCNDLLPFLWDLELMPLRYRLNAWYELKQDWMTFYNSLPATRRRNAPLLADHLVEVPRALVPLLHHSRHLSLDFFPGGGATIRYLRLKVEFTRYVAVYANKNPNNRKYSSLGTRNTVSRNRVLKLKAIFLLMVEEDLEEAGKNEGESAEQEPSLPPPPPPPIVEDAVVEEEQQQQHPHQDQPNPLPSPPPPSDDNEHDLLGFLNTLDFSSWPIEDEGQDDAEKQQEQAPEPPPLEDAVVEEEQQQQHPHQDQDQADSLSLSPSSPPPPPPDDHSEDNLLGLNLDDFSDWLDEQLDQNTEDDPDFFLNWDPLQPAPAASPVPEMVGLYATTPFVSDINGGDDDDNKDVPIKQKRPLADDGDDDDDIVNFDRWFAKYFPSGEPQLRSMNKEGGKRLKKASSLGLVTLITLGFIAAIIAIIWALYSVFRNSHLYEQQQPEEESTSATTAITSTDNI